MMRRRKTWLIGGGFIVAVLAAASLFAALWPRLEYRLALRRWQQRQPRHYAYELRGFLDRPYAFEVRDGEVVRAVRVETSERLDPSNVWNIDRMFDDIATRQDEMSLYRWYLGRAILAAFPEQTTHLMITGAPLGEWLREHVHGQTLVLVTYDQEWGYPSRYEVYYLRLRGVEDRVIGVEVDNFRPLP